MNMPIVDGTPGSPTPVGALPSSLTFGAPSHRSFDVLGDGEEFVASYSPDGASNESALHVVTGFRTLVEQLDPERE